MKMEKDDIAFAIEYDDDNTHITLTVVSHKSMTGKEYLTALEDFIDTHLENPKLLFASKYSRTIELH